MKNLKDKIALVTGAASGIGLATSLRLAKEGADIVIADLNEEGLLSVAEQIRSIGRKALPVKTNISNQRDVENLCKKAIDEFGRVDILVNNAGVALYAEFKDTDIKDWERVIGVNLWGPVYATKTLLPQMMERRSGHIVNISSWMGLLGAPANIAYTASKFGIAGLSEALRIEMEKFNIGVTAVYPGVVRTNIFTNVEIKGYSSRVRKVPDKAGITPDEMARRIVRAIKRNKAMVITGLGKFIFILKRISPVLGRGFGRITMKMYSKFEEGA